MPEPAEGNSAGALVPEAGEGKGSDEMPVPASGAAVPARGADRALRCVPRARRQYPWAELMRRVLAVDVLECPRCHGPMRILAAIHPPDAAAAILECLGLPARPPPAASARRVVGLFDPDPEWSRDPEWCRE